MVPEVSIVERILRSEDLYNHAVIQLGPGQPVVFPKDAYLLQVKAEEEIQLQLDHLERQQAQEIRQMIVNYQPKNVVEAPVEMKIFFKDESPISRPPYRLAPKRAPKCRGASGCLAEQWIDQTKYLRICQQYGGGEEKGRMGASLH